jgi:hypothetical protein
MSSVIRLRDRHPGPPGSRWSIKRLLCGVCLTWAALIASLALHVPSDTPPSTPPEPSAPLAKAAALREGALLYEYVDARSNKHVA